MSKLYDKNAKLELINRIGFKEHFKADSWEDFNKKFFDGLAPKYDALNEVLSLGQHKRIKKKAAQRLEILPNTKILDLCTGSGDLAIQIAEKNPSCEVVGADVSEKMLEIARERGKHLKNLEFKVGDALNLPFEDNAFDVLTIGFGIRNMADLEKGLEEIKRVVKAGGKFTTLDLGKPKGWFLNFIYRIHFLTIVPFLGKTIFHRGEFNSFKYLPESSKHFPAQERLVELFELHGFKNVKNYNYMLGSIAQQIAVV